MGANQGKPSRQDLINELDGLRYHGGSSKEMSNSGVRLPGRTSELAVDVINGIEICHRSTGHQANPTIIMIMGHSGSMMQWQLYGNPVANLAANGFHVIEFDNRDMGNTKNFDKEMPNPFEHLEGPVMMNIQEGSVGKHAYDLDDMADDAIAVLDKYGVAKAHVMGVSMGGVITHIIGVRYPDRCLSVVPIMTVLDLDKATQTAGEKNPDFFGKLMECNFNGPTPDMNLTQYLENRTPMWELVAADPCFPKITSELRLRIKTMLTADFQRGGVDFGANGGGRQSWACGQWMATKMDAHEKALKVVDGKNWMFMHGLADPILPIEHGRKLHAMVMNSRSMYYNGGHNFGNDPTQAVFKFILASIVEHCTVHNPTHYDDELDTQ